MAQTQTYTQTKDGTQTQHKESMAHAPADRELETRPGATTDHARCFFLLKVSLHAMAIAIADFYWQDRKLILCIMSSHHSEMFIFAPLLSPSLDAP